MPIPESAPDVGGLPSLQMALHRSFRHCVQVHSKLKLPVPGKILRVDQRAPQHAVLLNRQERQERKGQSELSSGI